MRRRIIVCLAAILLMASVSSAAIRFHGNGSWDMLEGIGQPEGWQSAVAPGAADVVRANWGGATVTLNYETTVGAFQSGVDESGTFQIQSGGILNAGNSKVGNNNFCTGWLTVTTGAVVNAGGD